MGTPKENLAARLLQGQPGQHDAAAAGLLHDIGLLILAADLPDTLSHAAEAARSEGRPLHDVERELTGTDHAQVGAYLLGLWGLPLSVVEAVSEHTSSPQVEGPCLNVVAAVQLADAIATEAMAELVEIGFEVERVGSLVSGAVDAGLGDGLGELLSQARVWIEGWTEV